MRPASLPARSGRSGLEIGDAHELETLLARVSSGGFLRGVDGLPAVECDPVRAPIGDVTLHLQHRSFFQTNTDVAAALYRQARAWADDVDARQVLDLYCGVGGFALHLADGTRRVHGVEIEPSAIDSARRSAADAGLEASVTFGVGDASTLVMPEHDVPDLVVVNPPRRGIGPDLCGAIEAARPDHVIYSSCNAASLAGDLAALPGYTVRQARVFDMFPQTRHHEVLVLLERA